MKLTLKPISWNFIHLVEIHEEGYRVFQVVVALL